MTNTPTEPASSRMSSFLRVPAIVWALFLLLLAWLLLQVGVPLITKWVTGEATGGLTIDLFFTQLTFEDLEVGAPLPGSLIQMYMILSALAVLVYVSITDQGLKRFFAPIKTLAAATQPASLVATRHVCVALGALIAASVVYEAKSVGLSQPVELRTIHPTLPDGYVGLSNPFPWTEANIARGRELYVANCSWCHGDQADGNGLFAGGLNPAPIDLSDPGTIAQLPENYLFWRIKEGGIGLPDESWPWSSAMPSWNPSADHMGLELPQEYRLRDEDIWLVIMGAYSIAGQEPAKRD